MAAGGSAGRVCRPPKGCPPVRPRLICRGDIRPFLLSRAVLSICVKGLGNEYPCKHSDYNCRYCPGFCHNALPNWSDRLTISPRNQHGDGGGVQQMIAKSAIDSPARPNPPKNSARAPSTRAASASGRSPPAPRVDARHRPSAAQHQRQFLSDPPPPRRIEARRRGRDMRGQDHVVHLQERVVAAGRLLLDTSSPAAAIIPSSSALISASSSVVGPRPVEM